MNFTIRRASLWGKDKPCEEAKPYEVTRVDVRSCETPEEFDKVLGFREGKWLENGTNHRVIDGCIARDNGTVKC